MSKPKPGLGKGLVRNLTVSQYPSQHHHHYASIITLAPVINQQHHNNGNSYSTSSSHDLGSSKKNNVANGWPNASSSSSSSSSSSISLLPTWDQPNDIVVPYHQPVPSSSRIRLKGSNHSIGHTSNHSRKYSSISVSPSAFLTSPIPPSLFFEKSLSYQYNALPNIHNHQPSPAQLSLEALLTSLEPSSFTSNTNSGFNSRSNFDNPPPDPPPSPSPGLGGDSSASSSSRGTYTNQSQTPVKTSRSTESHTVLSPNPLSLTTNNDINSNNNNSQFISFSSQPLLAINDNSTYDFNANNENSSELNTSTYSSTLIFHLGCSGLAKERIPSRRSSSSSSRPPTPPRQRSFVLPEVEIPTQIKSVGVGEDAYFARSDGLCIADGVGGWSRSSSKGSADAGRWSRLLTHFVEEEVSDWWNGKEYYLSSPKTNKSNKGKEKEKMIDKSSMENDQVKAKDQQQKKKQGWARETWENRSNFNKPSSSSSISVSASTSPKSPISSQPSRHSSSEAHVTSQSQAQKEDERERRPIDPVEIMQRGFEKCLACINAEGIHGSSTCLLALLHNSTLHIANLGDCCLLLIRKGEVVFRTQEMQHAFNFPLQVGTHSRDEPMKDAQRYDIAVKKGDVVILGSDGLMDNLFDEDILEIVLQYTAKSSTEESSSSSSSNNQLPTPPITPRNNDELPFSPQQISEELCNKARSVSEEVTATTPFMCKAIEEGIDFVGGKKDDISVLVGVIGDRDDAAGEDHQGGSRLKLHT
ncbi:uncharacterized protein L201_000355 [Kwoniella dendrophila CBS 6074]|uniref:Protein phosphatase n=1 Tax=Kwoniella dendrophila CBS 6074 TaxID=1295534 RepID=A0AAX4JKG8_9TREE